MLHNVRCRTAILGIAFSVALLGGCNSAQVEPKKIPTLVEGDWRISSVSRMKIQFPEDRRGRPTSISLDIRVFVDSAGHPDMSTLQINGPGARENRAVITQMIQEATFIPAPENTTRHAGYAHRRMDVNIP